MPQKLHDELHRRAIAMGLTKDSLEYDRYVYGTLNKIDNFKNKKKKKKR